jgi:hypothetical protein
MKNIFKRRTKNEKYFSLITFSFSLLAFHFFLDRFASLAMSEKTKYIPIYLFLKNGH